MRMKENETYVCKPCRLLIKAYNKAINNMQINFCPVCGRKLENGMTDYSNVRGYFVFSLSGRMFPKKYRLDDNTDIYESKDLYSSKEENEDNIVYVRYVLVGKIKNIEGDVEAFNKEYDSKLANKEFDLLPVVPKTRLKSYEVVPVVSFNSNKTFLCTVDIPQDLYYESNTLKELNNWVASIASDVFYYSIISCIYENINIPLKNIDLDIDLVIA